MLFHYLRPDPDSLDPVGQLVDRIRLACLAMDLAGIAEHAFNLPEVDCSDADAGFIDVTFNQLGDEAHDGPFSNAASCAGIENDIKLYLVNKQLKVILRLDDELHADPELTSLGALLAMHRDYKCTSTLLVTDHAGKQITKGPALGDSSDWHVNESNMGEWDITRPTQVLTPEQTQNPPSASMLSERGVVELLATLEKTGHHKHNDPTSDWVFRHGPTARERFSMWNCAKLRQQIAIATAKRTNYDYDSDEFKGYTAEIDKATDEMAERRAVRQRLARHLARVHPTIFIDMKTDPACPWKDMRFFHGSRSPSIQERQQPAAAAAAETYSKCRLAWTETIDDDGKPSQLTAFTTPVFAEALVYGGHIYTYKLNSDGKTLLMLDMRNDYDEKTLRHKELDHVSVVFELSGIFHARGPYRVGMAVQLRELFKDAGVDGVVMNSDVEWIWFNPASVLDWVKPDTEFLTVTDILLNRTGRSGKYGENAFRLPEIGAFVKSMVDGNLDLHAFLQSCRPLSITLSELPITRWTMDTAETPFMTQFAASAVSSGASRLWTSFQLAMGAKTRKLSVYECTYADLWGNVECGMEHLRMSNHLMDGHRLDAPGAYKAVLPYTMLCEKLRVIGATLLVHLPNGHTQIVPPISQPGGRFDKRMYISNVMHRSAADIQLSDMPVRDPYEFKRKRESELDNEGKEPRLGGKALGKLCIC